MKFFYIVTLSGKPCALPSEAADSIWHAWLRWDPAGLERFCIEHFGKAIPHVERAGLEAGALLNSFVCCRRYEGVAFHALRLPALFRLDVRLKMRGGHGYWNRIGSGQIVYARLDVRGLGRRQASPHPELTQGALQATGLRYPCSVGITSSGDTTSFAFSWVAMRTAAAALMAAVQATAAATAEAAVAAVAVEVAAAEAIKRPGTPSTDIMNAVNKACQSRFAIM